MSISVRHKGPQIDHSCHCQDRRICTCSGPLLRELFDGAMRNAKHWRQPLWVKSEHMRCTIDVRYWMKQTFSQFGQFDCRRPVTLQSDDSGLPKLANAKCVQLVIGIDRRTSGYQAKRTSSSDQRCCIGLSCVAGGGGSPGWPGVLPYPLHRYPRGLKKSLKHKKGCSGRPLSYRLLYALLSAVRKARPAG